MAIDGLDGRSLLSYAKSLTLIPNLASVATVGCSDAALTDAFMGFEAFRCCGSCLEEISVNCVFAEMGVFGGVARSNCGGTFNCSDI